MTKADREINERIARACGWAPCVYGWCRVCGPNRDTAQTPRVPDYLTDPARLPEMWALCKANGCEWQMRTAVDNGEGQYSAWVHRFDPPLHTEGHDDEPQRALGQAIDGMVQCLSSNS